MKTNLKNWNKIREKIESEINSLDQSFNQGKEDIENYRKPTIDNLRKRLNTFLSEFNKIKTENESSAYSYLNRLKDLIEEGDSHIKDIELKMPKTLQSVKEDTRKRYYKLKFMMKEYYKDHKELYKTYLTLKDYIDKSKITLEKLSFLKEQTFKKSEIKRLKDENLVLEHLNNNVLSMIDSISKHKNDPTKYINKISTTKLDILEYHNHLEKFIIKLERLSTSGGDASRAISDILLYVDGQDELIVETCSDLSSNAYMSKNVVTITKINNYFDQNRQDIYRKLFIRSDNVGMHIWGKGAYWMYYYLFMDRLMFNKQYAIK